MEITVLPADESRFADVATLLAPGRSDAPACWCLSWRVPSSEFNALHGDERQGRLRELCRAGPAPGVVAYVNGRPVGWCSFGPRASMGRLQRSRTIQKLDDVPVWSVVCFVVAPGFRRKGVTGALLAAAVEYAAAHGAPGLEAYPVDPAGGRISGALAYVGTTGMFERAGFRRVEPTGARSAGLTRWLMRLDLTGPAEP